ncbi:hypothetical protein BASA60_010349 [Batrachochytrium salamandrivorans]|nr:hypothetical protein BASA60_010349 [Batrachochytrium salamandrivorans]
MRPTQALATAFKKTVSYILEDQSRLFDIDQHYNLRPSNNMLLAVSIKKPHEFLGDFSVDIKDVQAQMVNALITPTPHSTEIRLNQAFITHLLVIRGHLRMDSTPSSTGSLVQNIQDHPSPQGIDGVQLVIYIDQYSSVDHWL